MRVWDPASAGIVRAWDPASAGLNTYWHRTCHFLTPKEVLFIMKQIIVTVIVGLTLAAAPAFAQAKKARTPNKGVSDQTWVTQTAMGGMAEVELSKLAQQKASAADVKTFAQRMVDDHSKASDELKSIAAKKNITLPGDMDAKHKAVSDRLSKLTGAAFDRAYMQAMVADHTKAVADFKRESQTGKDPDIKAFAAKHLPTIEDHLKTAQSDERIVSTAGAKKGAATRTSGTKSRSTKSTPAKPAPAPANPKY